MENINPIVQINSWKLADPNLRIRQLKKELPRKAVGTWVFTKSISPLDLYVYLKARFGPPNGFQMALKNPSSDNFCHWHWTLQCGNNIMDFMGLTMRAEVAVEGFPSFNRLDGNSFEGGIKRDLQNYAKEMSVVRKKLEKWNLFVNPYNRLKKVIQQFSRELLEIELDKIELPKQPKTPEDLESFQDELTQGSELYAKALGLGTSLRLLAPVLAEAFVNLVIFLLSKPDIKKDDRIYKDVLRREIDVRVKTLHINCEGFKRPVSGQSKEFKSFHTLMNRRNDFLHGNIDPVKLKYDVIYFDQNIPLPREYKNFVELGLINSLIDVEPDTALKDVEIVENFVQFVLSHMDDHIAENIKIFMETSDPGWREDTMRAGVLFPGHLIDTVPGPPSLT